LGCDSQNEPRNWSKISAFVPLLYAKTLGVSEQNPTLNWTLDHGLLPKQVLLAKSVQLLTEACVVNSIENERQTSTVNHSKTLYKLALNQLQQLQEPHVLQAMCTCVAEYQQSIDGWQKVERKFFKLHRWPSIEQRNRRQSRPLLQQSLEQSQRIGSLMHASSSAATSSSPSSSSSSSVFEAADFGDEERLTFENYAHFERCMDFGQPKHIPALLSQWEQAVYGKYAAMIGFTCQAMAHLSGHRTERQSRSAFQFGRSFAFAFAANAELSTFLKGAQEERSELRLPLLLFLLSNSENNDCAALIDQLRDSYLCSLHSSRVSVIIIIISRIDRLFLTLLSGTITVVRASSS
jgi:hypothetical protein